MTGRVFIVTGASSGIGQEVARILCEGGNDVILACRSEERANRAIERIKKSNPSALATYMQLDLADLASVRKFVEDFHSTGKKLSVLINNAGVFEHNKDNKRQFTVNNFELSMGSNHLGHFLLTNLLLDDLKKTAASEGGDSRIVVVTSSMHDIEVAKKRGNVTPLDVDDIFLAGEGAYSGLQAYKNSKLANVLFTYEFARRLEGSGVKINAVCPGFIPQTELMRSVPGAMKFFCRYVLHGMLRFTKMTRTVAQGGQAVCSLALDEAYKDVSGKYFRDGAESKSSEESLDEEKQKKLWELSARYTHLEGYEPLDAPPPPVEPANEEPAPAGTEIAPTNQEAAGDKPANEVAAGDKTAIEKAAVDKPANPQAAGAGLVNGEKVEVEKEEEKKAEVNGVKEEVTEEKGDEVIKEKEVKKNIEETAKTEDAAE